MGKKEKRKKMTTKTFQTLLRRQGFYIISEILYEHPNGITLKKLRVELETRKAHYNNYARVKEMLLKTKLITYFLDSSNTKNVRLTDKGRLTWEKMNEIVGDVEEK